MTSNVAPLPVYWSSPSISIRSSSANTPESLCTLVIRLALQTIGRVSRPWAISPRLFGWLDARGVPELSEELIAVVTANDVVRHRDADDRGRLDSTVVARQQALQSRPHHRDHQGKLGDHDFGLDVDEPHSGVGLLVGDDELQCRVQLFIAAQARCRLADTGVEHLAFVDPERLEEFLLRCEPAIERRTGHTGLNRDLRQADDGLAASSKHFCGR